MIKRDCYYYFEEQDMGAHIPCCALQEFLGGDAFATLRKAMIAPNIFHVQMSVNLSRSI